MDTITALSQSFPVIIDNVVANSQAKDYYNEFGTAKAEKIRSMTTELLNGMMGYLKTANLDQARTDMRTFQLNTPASSSHSREELKALWADIIAEASLASPNHKTLLQQLGSVFDRLIKETSDV